MDDDTTAKNIVQTAAQAQPPFVILSAAKDL
jgi:hypothetical protein